MATIGPHLPLIISEVPSCFPLNLMVLLLSLLIHTCTILHCFVNMLSLYNVSPMAVQSSTGVAISSTSIFDSRSMFPSSAGFGVPDSGVGTALFFCCASRPAVVMSAPNKRRLNALSKQDHQYAPLTYNISTYLFAFLSIIKVKETFDFQIGNTRSCVSLKQTQPLISDYIETSRLKLT